MICRIYIYTEPRCDGLDFSAVEGYVAGMLPGAMVELRGPLLEDEIESAGDEALEKIAVSLAAAKVRDLSQPFPKTQNVLSGEVAYERRRLVNRDSDVCGLLYDAHAYSGLYRELLPVEESGLEHIHIVFTSQLLGTWEPVDRRYHARTVLCGSPSIVSIAGLVEAPAKSPAYYLARRGAEAFGLAEEAKVELAASFADDCLKLDDPRLTEVAKGYVMQAVVYRLTGEPFCTDTGCRLFNAHWQRELLMAQLGGSYEYCRVHEEFFRDLAKGGA